MNIVEEHEDIVAFVESTQKSEASDPRDRKLWTSLQINLELLVWSVINDGVISGEEERLMMNVLASHGVPNTEHTLHMLRYYLEQEMDKYHDYEKLHPEEKQQREAESNKIKAEIEKKLKEEKERKRLEEERKKKEKDKANDKLEAQMNRNKMHEIVETTLDSKSQGMLLSTVDSFVGNMGVIKQRDTDGSFVARFSQEQFQKSSDAYRGR